MPFTRPSSVTKVPPSLLDQPRGVSRFRHPGQDDASHVPRFPGNLRQPTLLASSSVPAVSLRALCVAMVSHSAQWHFLLKEMYATGRPIMPKSSIAPRRKIWLLGPSNEILTNMLKNKHSQDFARASVTGFRDFGSLLSKRVHNSSFDC